MHPRSTALTSPGRLAAVDACGGRLTYGEIETTANQGAHLFRSLGLAIGDAVCVIVDNRLDYFTVYWAAQRSGLYFVPISTRLTASEAAYIIRDSGAKAVVVSAAVGPMIADLIAARLELAPDVQAVISVGEAIAGTILWSDALAGLPVTAIDDESSGYHMAYSSGSTGRPKGVKLPLSGGPPDAPIAIIDINRRLYGIDADTVYLSPAPLYHTAPLFFSTMVQRLGGEVVVMHEFDAERALAMIERHRVTMTQMVPTMFIRLLKLPATTRERYDLSSLKVVVVSAAPCPAATKKAMIDWLGPIVVEYYSSSEGNGGTFITSDEALRRPGSVGRPFFGRVHICDDEGAEAKTGEIGAVYFEGGLDFAYHNDPEKTREARHPVHSNWTTSGDVGYLDDDGYLFLTDRKAFMIISGGVNIYPQEAENVLATHPKVADVAVFGTPNEEFGEEVKAVVQPADWSDVGPDFEQELIQFCRSHLSAIKCPRSVDFDRALPRHPNGKLYKKGLRDRYLLQPGGGAP